MKAIPARTARIRNHSHSSQCRTALRQTIDIHVTFMVSYSVPKRILQSDLRELICGVRGANHDFIRTESDIYSIVNQATYSYCNSRSQSQILLPLRYTTTGEAAPPCSLLNQTEFDEIAALSLDDWFGHVRTFTFVVCRRDEEARKGVFIS